jgi:serine/threonine protein kinase
MEFKLPTLKSRSSLLETKNDGLPSFKFETLMNKDVIGRGAFGLVYKAKYDGETVVVKKLLGESLDDENGFKKEAKLLSSTSHENIVLFKGFCSSPYAIMMEYLCFEFSPFELSKEASNLTDFLNFMDKIDGFGYFEDNFSLKIGQEISEGWRTCILKKSRIVISRLKTF